MFRSEIPQPRFAPFRLSVFIAMTLAMLVIGYGTRPASALEWIYVSMGNNSIVRYDVSLASGASVQASANVFVPTGQGLNYPIGLAFDEAGNLYAANGNGNTITKYGPTGNRIGTDFVPAGQGLNAPWYLAFDAAGYLYAANYVSNSITRYDSSGTYLGGEPFVSTDGPMGLAFDADGNLYVANYNAKPISKYNSAGAFQFS